MGRKAFGGNSIEKEDINEVKGDIRSIKRVCRSIILIGIGPGAR